MPDTKDAVMVTQEDREVAAALAEWLTKAESEYGGRSPWFDAAFAAGIMRGAWDNHPWVEAFARHRLSTQSSMQGRIEELEAALRPFAEKAAMCDFGGDDYCPDWSPFIPVGAYRTARATLSKGGQSNE